jgi:hypothetical protein
MQVTNGNGAVTSRVCPRCGSPVSPRTRQYCIECTRFIAREEAKRNDGLIVEMRQKGHSLADIAVTLGISRQRIHQRLQRWKGELDIKRGKSTISRSPQ